MALSIGVQRGSKIKVGQRLLTVLDLEPMVHVLVDVDGHRHAVTDKQRTEIMPGVFLSLGLNPGRKPPPWAAPSARLAFEAPRSIEITRQ